jgi:hypothetical protein
MVFHCNNLLKNTNFKNFVISIYICSLEEERVFL